MIKHVSLLLVAIAAITSMALLLHASVKGGYQTARITSVKKLDTSPQFVGGNPTDAPLHADEFAYEIGVRVECTNYIGRYESFMDYLPKAIAPDKQVDVRLEKHWMYLSLPTDREIKMGIVHYEKIREADCPAKN